MTSAFELIKVSIGKQDKLSHIPSDNEWKELYQFAVKQTLIGILFSGIEKLPREQCPPKIILLKWYKMTEKIIKRNELIVQRTNEIVSLFEADGLRSVILKGQGLAQLYPAPNRRMSGDIDVWVEGKRDKIVRYLRSKGENGRIVYHNMPVRLFPDVSVEVHFTPSWMNNYFTNRKLQAFFRREQESFLNNYITLGDSGIRIPVPSNAFNRIFVLQHIYRHLFGSGIGLRQVVDYYYVLKQGFTQNEREEAVAMLKSLHMTKFAAAMMYVLHHVFCLEPEFMLVEPDEKEGSFLFGEIIRAGNFGHYDSRIKIPKNESKIHSFFRITKQNMRLLRHYPEETLWNPVYRAWHYFWRKYKGYPIK